MDRGKAEFKTMDTIKTEADNPNPFNITRNFHKEDVQCGGGPKAKVIEHDPMKDIMETKGLVHHMEMPNHIMEKGAGHVEEGIEEKGLATRMAIPGAIRGSLGGAALGAGGGALFSKEGEGGKNAKKWGKRGLVGGAALGAGLAGGTGHIIESVAKRNAR
jgi:hypothetical protein